VIVAHLSDPHLRTGPIGAESATGLFRALGRAVALRPDFVVITGDLAEHGLAAEYDVLGDVLAGVPVPVHLVAGNHDDPVALARVLSEPGPQHLSGGLTYSRVHDGANVVVLDSHGRDQPAGHLGADQLDWLDATLASLPDQPTFLCLHHPPVCVGIPFLDAQRLTDADALATEVRSHAKVTSVLAGHVHRAVDAPFAGVGVHTAPSTYRQSSLTLREGEFMGYVHEPPGFLLHVAHVGVLATHVVPAVDTAATTAHF